MPTGPLHPVAYARDDRGRDVTEEVVRPRRPIPRRLRPRLLPGRGARPLGRGRARRRRAARPAAPARRTRLDSSDRQLDQRRHRAGRPGQAAGPGPGSPGRRRKLDGRAARPGLSGGQEQDDPRRSRRHLPPERSPPLPAPDEPGSLLGLARRRRRRARDAAEDATARPAIGRAAASRLLADDPGRRQLARAAAVRHPHRHGPALARPDRLLHAVRRRPRAA